MVTESAQRQLSWQPPRSQTEQRLLISSLLPTLPSFLPSLFFLLLCPCFLLWPLRGAAFFFFPSFVHHFYYYWTRLDGERLRPLTLILGPSKVGGGVRGRGGDKEEGGAGDSCDVVTRLHLSAILMAGADAWRRWRWMRSCCPLWASTSILKNPARIPGVNPTGAPRINPINAIKCCNNTRGGGGGWWVVGGLIGRSD